MDIRVNDLLKLKVLCPAEDATKVFSIVEKNRQHLQIWLPWAKMNSSVEHEKSYLQKCLERYESGCGMEMGIFNRTTNEHGIVNWNFIGMAGFVRIERETIEDSFAEVGYWLDYDHRGQGIATKCCQKLLEFAFTCLNLDKLKIVVHQDNQPSISVADRLKFKLTNEKVTELNPRFHAEPNKLLVFAICKRDWRDAR
uniref:ribosomal-protein-serine acetyltransferase-like n=1 Tax=Styela clava TaxID=7725 RepID=UPI00193AA940|nr:ribosomal-protein-serine acetyltransferase-like [Styela clava]